MPSQLELHTGKLVVGGATPIDANRSPYALARLTTGLEPTPAHAAPGNRPLAPTLHTLLLSASGAPR